MFASNSISAALCPIESKYEHAPLKKAGIGESNDCKDCAHYNSLKTAHGAQSNYELEAPSQKPSLSVLISACANGIPALSDGFESKKSEQTIMNAVPVLKNLGDEDDHSSDEYSYPSASKRRLIGKASTQRSKHNKNNRIRLRAISDRISQLRELLEETGQRVGPSKLEILTACSRHLQTIQLLPNKPSYVNGFASSLYTQLFENSDEPQLMVEMSRPTATSIVNVNNKFLLLTGWTRQNLVSQAYSSIVEEPHAWGTYYRSMAEDDRVVALHISNSRLTRANRSKIVVNMHVRLLRESECSNSLTLCFAIVSVGQTDAKPQIRVQYKGDSSFVDARYAPLSKDGHSDR